MTILSLGFALPAHADLIQTTDNSGSCGTDGAITCTESYDSETDTISYDISVGDIGDKRLLAFAIDFNILGGLAFDDFEDEDFDVAFEILEGLTTNEDDHEYDFFATFNAFFETGGDDFPLFGDGNILAIFEIDSLFGDLGTFSDALASGENGLFQVIAGVGELGLSSQIFALCGDDSTDLDTSGIGTCAAFTPSPTGVPEPGALGFLGLGFLGLTLGRRKGTMKSFCA